MTNDEMIAKIVHSGIFKDTPINILRFNPFDPSPSGLFDCEMVIRAMRKAGWRCIKTDFRDGSSIEVEFWNKDYREGDITYKCEGSISDQQKVTIIAALIALKLY